MLGGEGTLVVALDASPETILARLQRQADRGGEAVERPLLAGIDPLARIRDLKSARQSVYDRAHLTISSDGISADRVAEEIADISRIRGGEPLSFRLDAASGASDIRVGPAPFRGLVSGFATAGRRRGARGSSRTGMSDRCMPPRSKMRLRESGFAVSTHTRGSR